ncbi:MAG TPA: hypothetical protein VGK90_09665 [Rhizomicrobium sp.]|jgi:hypothetical protein
MIAQCWLHIGTEKTGTTSIQNFLAANRTALRSQGFLYPSAPGRVSHPALVAFSLDDNRIDGTRKARSLSQPAQISAYRRKLTHELEDEVASSNVSKIILSSELLSSRIRSPAELERIRSLCSQVAKQTKIIVYIRNQVDFLISRYTTVIQAGGWENFRPGVSPLTDYKTLLDRWAGTFGRENLIVRRFEPADFANGDLLADFSATVGINAAQLSRVPRCNESLDTESLTFLRAINRHLPLSFKARTRAVRALAVYILQQRRGGTKFVVPEELADRLQVRFQALNERISTEYFGGRFQPLFSPPTLVGNPDALPDKPLGVMTTLRIAGFLASGAVGEALKLLARKRSVS